MLGPAPGDAYLEVQTARLGIAVTESVFKGVEPVLGRHVAESGC